MTRIAFLDRDGVLIEEPADFQIDSYAKFRLVDGVIPALLRIRDAGYQFVMVSNQDGLGTTSFPREDFDGPQALLLRSEEHTSELQSLMRSSYAVFCLKKKKKN